MIRNEGPVDRSGRLVLVAAALVLSWWLGFGSIGGIALLAFAGWMLTTAVLGYCALYQLFHISTDPDFHRTSVPHAKVAQH